MPRIADIPTDLQTTPFTRRRALDLGLTRYVIEGPRFRRVHPQIYVASGLDLDHEQRVDAARLALPDTAIASHDTACRLLGLPLPRGRRDDGSLHFWVPDDYTGRDLEGVTLHRYDERPQTVQAGGRTVSTPGKTFIDMATRTSLPDLVAIGDAVVRRCGYLPLDLAVLAREPRRRWIRRARQAARLVRARVDSAPETHLRLAIVDDGMPEPEPGRNVFDADGGWIAVPDLSWQEWMVAVEYDGEHHLKSPRQRRLDLRRVENLERAGWTVVVVTADELYRFRAATLTRIRQALVDAGAPVV